VVDREDPFAAVAFVVDGEPTGLFVSGAASPWSLGDRMPGES
jgi:hypothetical protein